MNELEEFFPFMFPEKFVFTLNCEVNVKVKIMDPFPYIPCIYFNRSLMKGTYKIFDLKKNENVTET